MWLSYVVICICPFEGRPAISLAVCHMKGYKMAGYRQNDKKKYFIVDEVLILMTIDAYNPDKFTLYVAKAIVISH